MLEELARAAARPPPLEALQRGRSVRLDNGVRASGIASSGPRFSAARRNGQRRRRRRAASRRATTRIPASARNVARAPASPRTLCRSSRSVMTRCHSCWSNTSRSNARSSHRWSTLDLYASFFVFPSLDAGEASPEVRRRRVGARGHRRRTSASQSSTRAFGVSARSAAAIAHISAYERSGDEWCRSETAPPTPACAPGADKSAPRSRQMRRQLVRQGHLLRAGRGRRAVQRAEQRRVLERRQRGRAHLFQRGLTHAGRFS